MIRPARGAAALALALPLTLGAALPATGDAVGGAGLEVTSELPAAATALIPGTSVEWTVGISTPGAAADGIISRTLTATGPLADHLTVAVDECADRECAAPHAVLVSDVRVADETIDLGSQDLSDARWLVISVTMTADAPASAQEEMGVLRLEARGAGETIVVSPGEAPTSAGPVPVSPSGPLALTGATSFFWALLAAMLLGGGVLLIAAARRRTRDEHAMHDTDERSTP